MVWIVDIATLSIIIIQVKIVLAGSFPWQVALLTNKMAYIGGGVLINHQTVLTVAHKVKDIP